MLLTYSGENADVPLMSQLIKEFQVDANIIYGNIELLNGSPLGQLVLSLSGEASRMEAAFRYIQSKNIQMEVISQ